MIYCADILKSKKVMVDFDLMELIYVIRRNMPTVDWLSLRGRNRRRKSALPHGTLCQATDKQRNAPS